jgi:integrase/recombinase XerD
MEDITKKDPTLTGGTQAEKKITRYLSFEEIEAIIGQIDMSKPEGGRNKAILGNTLQL